MVIYSIPTHPKQKNVSFLLSFVSPASNKMAEKFKYFINTKMDASL
jgi:hypothetical protein